MEIENYREINYREKKYTKSWQSLNKRRYQD